MRRQIKGTDIKKYSIILGEKKKKEKKRQDKTRQDKTRQIEGTDMSLVMKYEKKWHQ